VGGPTPPVPAGDSVPVVDVAVLLVGVLRGGLRTAPNHGAQPQRSSSWNFPFMVEFRSVYAGRLLFVGTGLSDYLDVIVRAGWEDKDFGSYIPGASQKALQRYQWSSLYIWDAVEIAHIGDSSCLALLRGEEPYKLRWSPRIIPTDRLILGQHRTARIPYAGYHALRPRAKLYAGSRSAPLWIKSAVGTYRTLRHRVNHSRDNLVTGVFNIFRPTGASRVGPSNLETMHSLTGVT
jgi:hypothetical protein